MAKLIGALVHILGANAHKRIKHSFIKDVIICVLRYKWKLKDL